MSYVPKRRSCGGWISRWLSANADVRDSRDLAALCLSYLIVAAIGVGLFLLFTGGPK